MIGPGEFAAAKGLLELVGSAVDLAKKAGNKELNEKILELHGELLKLLQANLTLTQRVAELEAAQKTRETLEFDGHVYWVGKRGDRKNGPYCTKCWDADQKLLRVMEFNRGWRCPQCSTYFETQKANPNWERPKYDPLGGLES